MKTLSSCLAVIGLLCAAIGIFMAHFGKTSDQYLSLRVYTDVAVILGTLLVLLAVLIRFFVNRDARALVARDVRILFWLGSIAAIALVGLLVVKASERITEKRVIDEFRKTYFSPERFRSHFLGVLSVQYPTDNWIMQEIISETKPDFVIETGTAAGGTALFYATILEKINHNGRVITVDIRAHDPQVLKFNTWRERVEAILGNSVAPDIFDLIRKRTEGRKVLVTLDSDHSKEHVLKEMELYSQLVSLDSYMVVQDTQLNGHPIPSTDFSGPEGPWEAVHEFLKKNNNFEIDKSREKHLITAHPSGFLKRVR